jgi:transposase InsO family protein
LRRAQNEFELRIKKIRGDNGTEFKNSQIDGFLEEEGIKHEFSSPYTPQQNGVVERKNITLFVNITLLCPLLSHTGWRMH